MSQKSAKVTLSTTVDLSPFIDMLSARANALVDDAKDARPIDDAARAEVGAALDALVKNADDALARGIRYALPDGVSLVRAKAARDGLTMTSVTELALDDAALLPRIVLGEGDGAPRPFAGFVVDESGEGWSLSGEAPVPPAGGGAGALVLTVDAARAPKTHNATRVDGTALVWELAPGAKDTRVQATFAR